MNKNRPWLHAGVCALLLLTSAALPAAAEEAAAGQQPSSAPAAQAGFASLDRLAAVNLDTVLQRAVDGSHNMALLYLKSAALHDKQKDLEEQAEGMEGRVVPAVTLPGTPAELAALVPGVDPAKDLWLGPVSKTNLVLNGIMQGQAVMADEINKFIFMQREQMESTAHQLETDGKNAVLQASETKEAIRLQMTAQYTQLLGLKKQLQLMNEYEALLAKEQSRAQLLQAAGLASDEDVRTASKAYNKQKDDNAVLANNYRLALVQLSFDIAIEYNPELALEDIPEAYAAAPIAQPDTRYIVDNSYPMKMAGNNVESAQWDVQNTDTSTDYGNGYLHDNMAISMQKKEQTRLELSKKVEAAYTEAQNAYQACLTEQRSVAEVQADYAKMQIRYDNGVISLFDFNKFAFKLHQSRTSLEAAQLKYFTLTRKLQAMENGFIS